MLLRNANMSMTLLFDEHPHCFKCLTVRATRYRYTIAYNPPTTPPLPCPCVPLGGTAFKRKARESDESDEDDSDDGGGKGGGKGSDSDDSDDDDDDDDNDFNSSPELRWG